MKWLIFLLLIQIVYADTTFFDNPDEFFIMYKETPSIGIGGGRVIIEKDESIIDFSVPILTYTIIPLKNISIKNLIIKNIGNTTFKGYLTISKNLTDNGFYATICYKGLIDCNDYITLKKGESLILHTNYKYNKTLDTGIKGWIRLSSEQNIFELPVIIKRIPMYNLQKTIADDFNLTEKEAFFLIIFTITLIFLIVFNLRKH